MLDQLFAASAEQVALLAEQERLIWKDSVWTPDVKSVFVYDHLRRTEQRKYDWNGDGWQIRTRTRYAVEENDLLVETRDQWDAFARDFLPVDRYQYVDGPGQTFFSTVLYRTWTGDAWVDDERTTYSFSDIGGTPYVTGGLTESWTGTSWMPVEQFEVAAYGNDVVYATESFDGSGWVDVERTVFHAISLPELQERVAQIIRYLTAFRGLNLGAHLVPAHMTQEWDGNGWVNSNRLIHESLDAYSGLPASIRYDTWAGGEWEAHMRQSVSYYEARPTSIMFGTFDGREWYAARIEDYAYDINEDLVRVTVQLP